MSQNSDNTTTLARNKVLILYILKQIAQDIREDDLFKIISTIDNINYFIFKQILKDLIDSKLVDLFTKDDDQVVKITVQGINAHSLTKNVLPGLVKLKADNTFKEVFSKIEEESSVVAEFIPKDENNYTVKCKIVENNETIFEIKTYAGSRERAKKIVDNWEKNASTLYPQLLNILFEKDK